MVGGLVFGHKSEVTLDEGCRGLLNGPLADVAEGLTTDWRLLRRLGWCPAFIPAFGELFEEGCFDFRGLVKNTSELSIEHDAVRDVAAYLKRGRRCRRDSGGSEKGLYGYTSHGSTKDQDGGKREGE